MGVRLGDGEEVVDEQRVAGRALAVGVGGHPAHRVGHRREIVGTVVAIGPAAPQRVGHRGDEPQGVEPDHERAAAGGGDRVARRGRGRALARTRRRAPVTERERVASRVALGGQLAGAVVGVGLGRIGGEVVGMAGRVVRQGGGEVLGKGAVATGHHIRRGAAAGDLRVEADLGPGGLVHGHLARCGRHRERRGRCGHLPDDVVVRVGDVEGARGGDGHPKRVLQSGRGGRAAVPRVAGSADAGDIVYVAGLHVL